MAHILVVDDDQDFLRVVQTLLEHAGHSVVVSVNAHDALDRFNYESFDLIFSDANMPGGSGFDLVKTIRKNFPDHHAAIAMITGRRDKKDVVYGLECGADDYIIKPIDPDLFLAKVQSLTIEAAGNSQQGKLNFSSSPVHMAAKWEVSGEILQISEKGLVLSTYAAPKRNTKLKLQSDIYTLIGIDTPTLRVTHVEADPNHENLFHVSATFVGLVEGELQKIRFWVNSNAGIQKRKDSA